MRDFCRKYVEHKGVTVATLLLVLLWMGVIFYFSSQDGASSGRLSESLSEKLSIFQNKVLNLGWTKRKIMEISILIEEPLRKMAHATEYMILGFLLSCHLVTYRIEKRLVVGSMAWVIAVVYAVSDEIHQLFSAGRSAQLSDVCIDSLGALVGVVFALLCFGVWRRIRERRQQKKVRTAGLV